MSGYRDNFVTTLAKHNLYFCPGEELPVSWSIHLARLAAFYPKCFECPLRHQTGHLPAQIVEQLRESERTRPRTSLLSECGIRGVYLNELNRFHAAAYVNSFVRFLSENPRDTIPKTSLSLAIGYQEHPSAPDITVGIVNALRASGVRIVDVGLTVGPLISRAISDCDLDGGVLVSGSGCNPAWIGLDFLADEGIPMNDSGALRSIEAGRTSPIFRLPDGKGGYRTHDPAPSCFEDLTARFHALRPLRVAIATPLGIVAEVLERLFASLPCSLELITLPRRQRQRQRENPDDPDLAKLGATVTSTGCHLGFLIEDDARTCAVLDETGCLVPFGDWSRLLLDRLTALEIRAGRIWESDPIPRCDALLTLAHLLTTLSHSDKELSEQVIHQPQRASVRFEH